MDYRADVRTSRKVLNLLKQAVTTVDLVKTAEAAIADEATAYADPTDRLVPIHTKEATLVSVAYAAYAHSPERVQKALTKAAQFWDVSDQAEAIRKEIASIGRAPKFAGDLTIDGRALKLFPYHDQQSFEKAAQAFCSERHKLPLEARQKTAQAILGSGFSIPGELVSEIQKSAADGCGSYDNAMTMVMGRKGKTSKKKVDDKVQKLAQIILALEGLDGWEKTALEAFDIFDTETGLNSQYGRGLPLPESDLFVDGAKVASAQDFATLANGHTIRISDIDWTKVAEFDPALASTVQGDPKKAAEILPTWPRPDADTLMDMLGLKTAGQDPKMAPPGGAGRSGAPPATPGFGAAMAGKPGATAKPPMPAPMAPMAPQGQMNPPGAGPAPRPNPAQEAQFQAAQQARMATQNQVPPPAQAQAPVAPPSHGAAIMDQMANGTF